MNYNLHDPHKLFSHPFNLALYGDERPDAELIASIREKGVLDPVDVVSTTIGGIQALYILSGHRRVAAAKQLHIKVPIQVRQDEGPLWQQEFLLMANIQRIKTPEQKAREFIERERIEKEKAEKRRAAGIREQVSASARAATATGVDDGWARRMKVVVQAAEGGDPIAIEGLTAINAGKETPDTVCRRLYPRGEKSAIVSHYEDVARKFRQAIGMFQVAYAPRPEEPSHGFIFKHRFVCEEEAEAFIKLFAAIPKDAMDEFVRVSRSWRK